MKRLVLVLAVGVASTAPAQTPAAGTLGFYRSPAIHGETIVFAAEGDLWTVPIGGGLARRLTSHAAEESSPAISPDGATVAFTARYEGPAALYTMPITGGAPLRRTYDGDNANATTWTPDGKLVYTTLNYAGIPKPGMVQLDLRNGTRTLVPLAGASEGTYDGTGRTIFFVRPAFHNNVTKRYTGGTARDIWKFTTGSPEAVELTGDYNGESHSPMWWNGRVYFISDRDGTMNVWSMRPDACSSCMRCSSSRRRSPASARRLSSIVRCIIARSGPRSHSANGNPKPFFGRCTRARGRYRSANLRVTYLRRRCFSFIAAGIRMANSAIRRSTNGLRSSRLWAMDMRSVIGSWLSLSLVMTSA